MRIGYIVDWRALLIFHRCRLCFTNGEIDNIRPHVQQSSLLYTFLHPPTIIMDKHPFPQDCPQEVFGASNENQIDVVEWMIFVYRRFEIVLQFHNIESGESKTAVGCELIDCRRGDRGGEECKGKGREDTLSLCFGKVPVSHRCEKCFSQADCKVGFCVR